MLSLPSNWDVRWIRPFLRCISSILEISLSHAMSLQSWRILNWASLSIIRINYRVVSVAIQLTHHLVPWLGWSAIEDATICICNLGESTCMQFLILATHLQFFHTFLQIAFRTFCDKVKNHRAQLDALMLSSFVHNHFCSFRGCEKCTQEAFIVTATWWMVRKISCHQRWQTKPRLGKIEEQLAHYSLHEVKSMILCNLGA